MAQRMTDAISQRAALQAPTALPHAPVTPSDTQDYFTEVADDYRAWSPGYNMHFGFWRAGLNPLRREGMLVEMNRAVGRALRLDPAQPACVVDLGCGAGATARTLAAEHPKLYAVTVTNVAVQNTIAARLDAGAGVADRVAHVEADYTRPGPPRRPTAPERPAGRQGLRTRRRARRSPRAPACAASIHSCIAGSSMIRLQ